MTDNEEFLSNVRDRFDICVELEQDNRTRALEAIRFRDLNQWPDEVKNARENDPNGQRPCLTIDKVNQYVRQVCNDQRQNRPQIKVRPNDDYADVKTAEVFNGLIRNICDQSRADIAFDTAFEHASDGGYGYFRVLTEYIDDMAFDQCIKIARIRNRFSVYLGPHQEIDGSDAEYAFITDWIPKEEYKRDYSGKESEWEEAGVGDTSDWYKKDELRIAEYFYTDYQKATIYLLEDGYVVPKELYDDGSDPGIFKMDGLGKVKQSVVKERDTYIKTIKWKKITGTRILEERDWAGKWLPVIKVTGVELDIEGKLKLSGMVRPAMDSCRMYNYAASAFVEMVALAPKAPWVAADGQVEGREDEWAQANRVNTSVLRYKPVSVDGTIVPAPQRVAMPGVPQGWGATMQFAENDIQGNMGMYKAALGAPSAETSGKAILAKQRESDSSTFHFIDNLSSSMIHLGRILIDLIPKIYDTARIARILGEDGSHDAVKLDPEQQEARRDVSTQDGIKSIYNLGVGRYDVTVTTGPSYTTKRAEAAEGMVNVIQASPELMNVAGDLMFKNLDWPGADEMAKRMNKMLPPQLQDKDENDPQVVIQQLQGQLQQQQQAMESFQQEAEQVAKEKEALVQGKAELQKMYMNIQSESHKNTLDKEKVGLTFEQKMLDLEKKQAEIEKAMMDLGTLQDKVKYQMECAGKEQGMAEREQMTSQREAEVVQNVTGTVVQAMSEIVNQSNAQVVQHNEATVNAALGGVALAVEKMAAVLSAPKVITRDADGRPSGVKTI